MFYGLEDSGLLNIDNPIDLLALQMTIIPRINFALEEYTELYNNHPMRTANNWTPNQMWMNGMLNEDNPLASGGLDTTPEHYDTYGIDPMAPTPFENSDNNIVIPELELSQDRDSLERIVLSKIDPLEECSDMGIGTFTKIKDILVREINQD